MVGVSDCYALRDGGVVITNVSGVQALREAAAGTVYFREL